MKELNKELIDENYLLAVNTTLDKLLEATTRGNIEAIVVRVELVIVVEGELEALTAEGFEMNTVARGNMEAPTIELLKRSNPRENLEALEDNESSYCGAI